MQQNTNTDNKNTIKPKFVAKGHDAILKSGQDTGGTINITTMSGEVLVGMLINRDKYTVTLDTKTGERLTVYKHAIESFSIVRGTK